MTAILKSRRPETVAGSMRDDFCIRLANAGIISAKEKLKIVKDSGQIRIHFFGKIPPQAGQNWFGLIQ